MSRISYCCLVILIGAGACSGNRRIVSEPGVRPQNKEFIYHLNKLDSASMLFEGDTVFCCPSSISFMVKNTQIYVGAPGTYLGYLYFTRQELARWHEYYDSNKHKLNPKGKAKRKKEPDRLKE